MVSKDKHVLSLVESKDRFQKAKHPMNYSLSATQLNRTLILADLESVKCEVTLELIDKSQQG